eukprot:g17106.t1
MTNTSRRRTRPAAPPPKTYFQGHGNIKHHPDGKNDVHGDRNHHQDYNYYTGGSSSMSSSSRGSSAGVRRRQRKRDLPPQELEQHRGPAGHGRRDRGLSDDDDDAGNGTTDDDGSLSWSQPQPAAARGRLHNRVSSNFSPSRTDQASTPATAGRARRAGDRDGHGHARNRGGGGGDDVRTRARIGAAARTGDRESSPIRLRLAERLGELESKLKASSGGGGGGASAGAAEGGGVGSIRVPSTAENEVQSAALRHALLLEERGLQLERVSAQLQQKEEEEGFLKSELRRLGEASVADREAWRRLAKAEGEISLLQQRSEGLEDLAKRYQASLEGERHARKQDKKKHASELERVTGEAAAAAEAAAREEIAATSSRDLCEQMSGVCRQMRQAAEEAGARCAAAEETAGSLQAKVALADVTAKDAERELEGLTDQLHAAEQRQRREEKLLHDKLEAADRESRRIDQALKDEKETNFTLRELLKDREARLEKAEGHAVASLQGSERSKRVSEELRRKLERNLMETEQLRSRLQVSGDLAADEAGRAREALQSERTARSELASAVEREEDLRSENACLAAKIEELRATLVNLSDDLSETSKLSQDRLVDSEVSSRAAAAAERRSESLERRSAEAARAAEAAQSVAAHSDAARAEAERSLAAFQASMARALGAVEDALVDTLRGVGVAAAAGGGAVGVEVQGDGGRSSAKEGDGVGFAKGQGVGSHGPGGGWLGGRGLPVPEERHGWAGISGGGLGVDDGGHGLRRGRERHLGRCPTSPPPRSPPMWASHCRAAASSGSFARAGGAYNDGGPEAIGNGTGNGDGVGGWLGAAAVAAMSFGDGVETCVDSAAKAAAATAAMTGRLERVLGRIMRRIDGARELRSWVEREVECARAAAMEGLHDLRGRWDTELTRLQSAERKLLRLQEQAKYGGRRAALDAREECYAKIERVEKEKWGLRDCLVAEKRQSELLESQASRLRQQLSGLSDQLERLKAEQSRWLEEKERLLANQEVLQAQLEQQRSRGWEKEKELEEQRSSAEAQGRAAEEQSRHAEEQATRLAGLTEVLEAERGDREKERAHWRHEEERVSQEQEAALSRVSELLKDERVARDEETSRLTALLEEERRARRAESALGEAVLREVRETQGLLGEMSPGSDQAARGPRRSDRRTFRRKHLEQSSAPVGASALERQASRLERLLADAAALVKDTGRFFDRYSETHKEVNPSGEGTLPRAIPGSVPGKGGDCGFCRHCGASAGSSNPRPGAKPAFPQAYQQSLGVGVSSPTYHGSGSFAQTATATASPWSQPWRGEEERSRNFLAQTVEHGATTAAAAVGNGGGSALRELDRQCYSLLESNAQLCLKLQGLGLEYAGLTRVLLATGGEISTRTIAASSPENTTIGGKIDEADTNTILIVPAVTVTTTVSTAIAVIGEHEIATKNRGPASWPPKDEQIRISTLGAAAKARQIRIRDVGRPRLVEVLRRLLPPASGMRADNPPCNIKAIASAIEAVDRDVTADRNRRKALPAAVIPTSVTTGFAWDSRNIPRGVLRYVAASSGPKDVVIVVDISGSMDDNGSSRLDETLGAYSCLDNYQADVLTSENLLVPTDDNKEMLLDLLADVELGISTNFEEAMTTTFNLLEASRTLGDEASSECSTAILFLSDGTINEGLGLDDPSELSALVETLNAEIETQIFTFAPGPDADAFSEGTGGELGFTVASPAYDQAFDPPAFLGVSGVDFMLQSFLDAEFSRGAVEDAVFLGGKECPAGFNLTSCQLHQFRGSISAESVCDDDDGSCASTSVSVLPEACMEDDDYLDKIWSNEDVAGLSFRDRKCCGNDSYNASSVEHTCKTPDGGRSTFILTAIVLGVGAAVLIVFAHLVQGEDMIGEVARRMIGDVHGAIEDLVLHIAQCVDALDDSQREREMSRRKAFLQELEVMTLLRSLNTVNVYGVVTSLSDRIVLVMELMAGGDLLMTMLQKSKTPLPKEQSRRIIRDICTGMAFLHSKDIVHGDLKSANVLLDGDGRAKIGNFGTSRWTKHMNHTGLATYTTTAGQAAHHLTIAWSALEVLDFGGSSYASDVYSFGIVVWEVLTRELPWANKSRMSDIQSVLAQAGSVALELSRSAVEAFESRCVITKSVCEGLHFSACRSRLPDGECTSNAMTPPGCEEIDCRSVQDFSNPVVRIPASLQSDDNEVTDLDAIETICYGKILDGPLKEQFEQSQSPDEVSSALTYFGSWTGVMRQFPGANYGKECGDYDPRIRPWYVAASSGPKDVVIVVDVSGSMGDNDRFDLATDAVAAILGTMNEHTFVNVVVFSSAEVLTSESLLVPATDENKKMLLGLFGEVKLGVSTNFEEAMTTTFSLLEASRALGDEASSECSTAILFLSDGQITGGIGIDDPSEVSALVETLNAEIEAQIFTFALGPDADAATLKTIACDSGGIFQAVPDGGSLSTAMSFYYRYYAIGLGGNTDYTAYSSVYEFHSGGELGFTVASPAYDHAFDPPAFLGVSGVDFTLKSFVDLGFSEGAIKDAVYLGGRECPAAFNLTSCQLQQFRGSISTESVCDDDGSCGSTSISLEPARCMKEEEYPNKLWKNEDLAGMSFLDRNCCGEGKYDPSSVEPTCDGGGGGGTSIGTIVGAIFGSVIMFPEDCR